MNLELFPEVEPSELDGLLREIDAALDAGFLADMETAFDLAGAGREPVPDATAA